MARLSHPNIVAIHDIGQADELLYFVMEYVEGVNLRQAMQAGMLTPDEALAVVPQICDALQYAHDEDIIHRDIKPENILLDKRGQVKIADFGLSKMLQQEWSDLSLTGTEQVMATIRYMAPEQMQKTRDVDHRADIYSLGVVFYELLTGEVPMGHFDPPSKRVEIDVKLDEVVLRALAREPDKRYQQASELKTDVQATKSLPTPGQSAQHEVSSAAPDLHADAATCCHLRNSDSGLRCADYAADHGCLHRPVELRPVLPERRFPHSGDYCAGPVYSDWHVDAGQRVAGTTGRAGRDIFQRTAWIPTSDTGMAVRSTAGLVRRERHRRVKKLIFVRVAFRSELGCSLRLSAWATEGVSSRPLYSFDRMPATCPTQRVESPSLASWYMRPGSVVREYVL